MQETSETASEFPASRRDRGHSASTGDPEAKELEGDHRYPDLRTVPDRDEAGRKHLELEPDIGPDRGE